MYLAAQRVASPSTGAEGMNAFYYVHHATWAVPPPGIPDHDPGQLERRLISVPPPGNRVRSYLDVVAPDDASSTELRQGFITFVSQVQLSPLPWAAIVGRCMFRVGFDHGLALTWRQELGELYRCAETVRASG